MFGCYANGAAFANHYHHKKMILWSSGSLKSRCPTILSSKDTDSENNIVNPETEDPDGVPLFDTNEQRATLFGLEPNAARDPLDNPGLQFTGPLILFLSIYVTLSLFFSGDGDLVLFDNL